MTNPSLDNSQQIESIALPFTASVFGAFSLFIEKIKPFLLVSTPFAIILMILYFVFGQEALCINSLYRQDHSCSNNLISFILVHLLALFILCIFMRVWMQFVLGQKTFSWQQLMPQLADIKLFGLFVVYSITLIIAGFSTYLLIIRVPNPNWTIELAYFFVVSLGFFVPLLGLRFISYFAFAADNEPLPPLKTLWKKTTHNTFILLIGIMVLVFCGLLLSQYLLQAFMRTTQFDAFYITLGCEYLSNIIVLLITACFTNYCYLQKMFLFERNDNGKSNN